jgi:hypothetical protein
MICKKINLYHSWHGGIKLIYKFYRGRDQQVADQYQPESFIVDAEIKYKKYQSLSFSSTGDTAKMR